VSPASLPTHLFGVRSALSLRPVILFNRNTVSYLISRLLACRSQVHFFPYRRNVNPTSAPPRLRSPLLLATIVPFLFFFFGLSPTAPIGETLSDQVAIKMYLNFAGRPQRPSVRTHSSCPASFGCCPRRIRFSPLTE